MSSATKLREILANMGAYLDREPVDAALLRQVHSEIEEAAFAVLALLEPPKVVADRNIALAGLQTIRGVPLKRGDVVLATAQDKPVQNGLWVASAVAWARPGSEAERDRAEGRLAGAVCFSRKTGVGRVRTWRADQLASEEIARRLAIYVGETEAASFIADHGASRAAVWLAALARRSVETIQERDGVEPPVPYAKLLVRVNGGPLTSGGIDIVVGDVIELFAESTVGWGAPAPVWEIYGYPPSFAVPAGWSSVTVDGSTVYRFVGVGPPPAFTASVWGKYMLALHVNGLTDKTTALSVPSPGFANMSEPGGASPPARVLRPVPGSLRCVDASGRVVPATLHEKPDGSIDVAVAAQHGEHARIFWDVEGLTPDDLAEIEGRAEALGMRGGNEGQLLEDLARVAAELKRVWKTCDNAAPEDVPGDVPTITAVAPEHLPAGSKGARLWVMRENGRETALLALEPGGVLGEDVHERREAIHVIRGTVRLELGGETHPLFSGGLIPPGAAHRVECGSDGAIVAMWWTS